MCGIVGGLLPQPLNEKRLDAAIDSLYHRGPDSNGRWISPDDHWFLGHTRLSIIGLNNGQQPMADAGSDARMVVNGDMISSKALHGNLDVAVAKTKEGRRAFEQEFTQALQQQGVHAVASYTIKGGTDLDKEDVIVMAAEAEVDTALVTLFAGRDHSEVLHSGRKYYAYAPIYGRDYYGRGRVYGVAYQVGQTSDFWSQHNSIHPEASLYEIKTEDLLWRASSGMQEQSDVAVMRPAFIKSFMQDLAAQGLVN